VPEVLRSGAEMMIEVWGCLDCTARPEGTPVPPVPESAAAVPAWAIPSPCAACGKAYRLFVRGGPHIPGEPDRDVLICGQCGCTQPACSDCRGSNLVFDSIGGYCADCRWRPGQPKPESEPEREPCTAPAPLPSRQHALGEPPPTFDCPKCATDAWLEGIYSWRCKACQHIEMKPDGPWPKDLEEKSHFTEES
jgi:hypothetical protein